MASSYDISSGTGRIRLDDVVDTYVALQLSSSLDLDSNVTVKLQQTSDDVEFFDLEGTNKTITSISPTDTNYNIPDSSINARNGVTANMVTSDLQEDYAGDGFYNTKSLYFDGTDNIIENIGVASDWNFVKNTFIGTISFWVKAVDYADGSFRYVLGTGTGSTDKGWFVNYNGTTNKFSLVCGNGSSNILSNSSPVMLADNNWHHVAVTFDSSVLAWYLDGVYKGAGSGGFGTADTGDCNLELHVGDIVGTGNSPYKGNISELSIFSSDLSSTDISDLYNSGNPRTVLSNSEVANLELYQHYDYATNFNQIDSSYIESYDYTLNGLYLYVDVGSATTGTINIYASNKKKVNSGEVDATIIGDVNVEVVSNDSNTFAAFGELITTHKTPIVQIANKYQIDPSNLNDLEIFEATGGTADNSGNLFRCQTGTSVGGYGVLRSTETLNYRAGQGVEALFTASFTTGIALSLQFGGMFNISDTLAFGYDGTDFSCLHSYGGVAEVQMITVTATGAGTCTVTLDGTASSGITVTNTDVQTNAEEIRAGLAADALASSWRFEQVDDMVFCIAKGVGNKTNTMSVSGGVTANIAEQTQGVSQTDGHIAQASWNVTTAPFTGFVPTQLNVYKIQFGYLGVANINYYIYNPLTGKFVLVHQIEWSNANNTTHVSTPNFKIGWTSASLGASGTNLTVLGASASIFLEGDEVLKNNTFADSNSVTGVGATNTAIITIKNRIVYGDRFNLGKAFPISVSVDNDHTKGLIVDLYRDSTIGGTQNYQYEDEFNSIVIGDKAGTTLTGGDLIESFTVEKGSDTIIDLTSLKTELLPEQTFTIAARTISGTGAIVTASLTWKEEK